MSENVNPEAVEQLVQDVSSWYSEQVMKERRAAVPDPARLELLKSELAACAADQLALEDAAPDEVDAIAARYAARAQELKGQ
ncbi:hypothetical protein OHB13_38025 (plasmid) [Streptomyces sp. NBC_00440]|uniref:hypothetical protein n=1 Tax=unclassified Streptomyces TaxID=2593676 RepID=UPI002E1B0CEF|nr:hypothetical protein OG760_37380 [Streptomyces sp. NBC_00963]